MKKILVSVMLIAALAACNKPVTAPKEQKGEILAKVGSSTITEGDLDKELKSLPDYAQQMFADDKGKEKFLDELIKKEMLYQEAIKKGIDKSPDFTKKVEEFKKVALVQELLEKEIMSKAKVSDQEAKEYYDKHKEDFASTAQIKASHILVKTQEEAEKILEQLKKGAKFEDLAKKESLDKGSAKNGGDLGYFARGQMVPEFEKAAASMKAGELSAPVKTQYGFHIIKVTDKKAGPVIEFDRIKDLIAQKLSGERQKEAFDKYLEDLKKTYPVEMAKKAEKKKEESAKTPEVKDSKEKPAAEKAAPEKPAEKQEKKEAPKKEAAPAKEEAKPKAH